LDFELSEDLKMVQSLARDFVRDQLKPLERDLLGRSADSKDARGSLAPETDRRLISTAKEVGLWGASVPEEFGGVGLGALATCLVEEELAQTIVPFNFGDVTPILFECNEQQKQKYFLPALDKEKAAYVAIVERSATHDVGAWYAMPLHGVGNSATTVRRDDGQYVLNGTKISFSRPAVDYFAVVFAITGERGATTCFLVDKGTRGFNMEGGSVSNGTRQPLRLVFDNCMVPGENVLGQEGKAFSLGAKWLPSRRIVRAARVVGVAQRLLEEATARAQTWQSFGQPAGQQIGIQGALAEIAANIHSCRLMVYEAAWKADRGDNVRRAAAMVKLFAANMIHTVADSVAHIYGGPPYIAGLPMERLCRDALATSASELALDLQRSIIARDILNGLKV